jgi:hypothetical protein
VTRAEVGSFLDVQRRSYAHARPGLARSWPEADALDAGGLASLLDDVRYAVLATARPDGRAHASPIAFSVAERAFWIATVAGLRLRNVRATPWASLVVSEGDREGAHRALTAEGPVVVHAGAAFGAVRGRLDEAWIERHGHTPDWAVAFIELRPERLFSHLSRHA